MQMRLNKLVKALKRPFATVLALFATTAASADTVRLFAAGSLRAPMTEIAAAYTAKYGDLIEPVFGASGTLASRLTTDQQGGLFASADLGYPQSLTDAGKADPTVLFARNRLCVLSRAGVRSRYKSVLAMMLDPAARLATGAPENDPGGAYAWIVFKKADAVTPGARQKLELKTRKLGSGPGMLAAPPNTENALAWSLSQGPVDVFINYCTNGTAAQKVLPDITVSELPPELAVQADYGMTILASSNTNTARFAMFILSPAGQKILAAHGFDAPLPH